MTSESRVRALEDQGFVLHSVPWRETSLVIEVFTSRYGRFSMVAKGARRPRSALRGVVQPFQPLRLIWFGQHSTLRTLKSAEWLGGLPLLQGRALFCGFYLNELLLRLVAREEGLGELFLAYREALQRLSQESGQEPILRDFEYALLRVMGVAPSFSQESLSGRPLEAEEIYGFDADGAVVTLGSGTRNTVQCHGKTLLDMAQGRFEDARSLVESKNVMRWLLRHHLGGQELHTRRILQELPPL
ncbi:MAG: DNA repair protein RecO [Ferrovum sp.]|nr:DNA repair protein RecO [Ferrovum sp.]NDU87520.1 DNA repair protein RecO [Ferrovum sp.]